MIIVFDLISNNMKAAENISGNDVENTYSFVNDFIPFELFAFDINTLMHMLE